MKKLIIFLVVIMMISMILVSCQQTVDIPEQTTKVITTTTNPTISTTASTSSNTKPSTTSNTTPNTTTNTTTNNTTNTTTNIITTNPSSTTIVNTTQTTVPTTTQTSSTSVITSTLSTSTEVIVDGEISEYMVKYQKNWYSVFHSCLELQNGNLLVVGEISADAIVQDDQSSHITYGLLIVYDKEGNIIKDEIHEEYYTIAHVLRSQSGEILMLGKRSAVDGLVVMITYTEDGVFENEFEIENTEDCWPHHFIESFYHYYESTDSTNKSYSYALSIYDPNKLFKYSISEYWKAFKVNLLYDTPITVNSYIRSNFKLILVEDTYPMIDRELVHEVKQREVIVPLTYTDIIINTYYIDYSFRISGFFDPFSLVAIADNLHSYITYYYSNTNTPYYENAVNQYPEDDRRLILKDRYKKVKKGEPLVVEFYKYKKLDNRLNLEEDPYDIREYLVSDDFIEVSHVVRSSDNYYIIGIESTIDDDGDVSVGSFVIKSKVP